MADSIVFAQYTTQSAGRVFNYSQVELGSTHRFRFGSRSQRRFWGRIVFSIVLAAIGVGLLLSVNFRPTMLAPLMATSVMLILLGSGLFIQAWLDRQSGIAVDSRGVRGRIGFSPIALEWSQVDRWAIDQKTEASKNGMAIWFKSARPPVLIEGDYLDASDRRLLCRVFRAFLPAGEVDGRAIAQTTQNVRNHRFARLKWS